MDNSMLEQDILNYRMRANLERRNGNTRDGDAWDAEADALENRLIVLQRHAEWNTLADNRHG